MIRDKYMWDKLSSVFDMENPLMRALSVVADLILLNFLTILCMLPVITAGAAFTARNDVLQHIVRKEESYIVRSFFRSFKSNLKQGSIMGLLFMVPLGLLALEFLFIRSVPALHMTLLYAMLIFAGALVFACGIYAFHLLARYENTIGGTVKNALLLSLASFPRTLCMLASYALFWAAVLIFAMYLFPVILLFGATLPAYICALLIEPVFRRL